MLTATHLNSLNPWDYQPHLSSETPAGESPFGISGCLDAPQTIAAGGHRRHEARMGFQIAAFPMPIVINRPD